MPKVAKSKPKRACPLEKQLAFDQKPWYDQSKNQKKLQKRSRNQDEMVVLKDDRDDDDDDEEDHVLPVKLSRKTLELARQQQAEERQLEAQKQNTKKVSFGNQPAGARAAAAVESSDEDDDSDDDEMLSDDDDLVRVQDGYVEDVELCEEDEAVLANYMMGAPERRNLADIIMEKIQEKEARDRGELQEEEHNASMQQQFDPKIVEVYTGVGKILHRYTSGKLPKAFKVIPSLSYWEDILWLTKPDEWSPHAMRAATRLFASNLNPKMAQRFYNIFLLEHVRQDIREHKKLNYHLYMALKKALYKPQAFFKGIILPLCEGNDCTIREATIIASVLAKVSIPVIHSAAALMKLAEMSYSGANSLFIRVLLNKKYSLPTRVIGALSKHFVRFTSESRTLPVLWHHSLLVFTQRYKNDISKVHKEAMKALLKQHAHHQITAEIRRELFNEQ